MYTVRSPFRVPQSTRIAEQEAQRTHGSIQITLKWEGYYHALKATGFSSEGEASDFVVLATPLSDATHHLIGARELALMKSTAVLVNMARGGVVDETALIETMRAGGIAGAGLDVFAQEPLPADSPLWDLPNVAITPHTTPQVPDRTGRSLEMIVENVQRFRAGEPLLNLLTPADIYTQT